MSLDLQMVLWRSGEEEPEPEVSTEVQASPAQQAETNLPSPTETRSAFSDSSSDEDEASSSAKAAKGEDEGDPFADFDREFPHPVVMTAQEAALIEEAEVELSPNALHQGAVLPLSGSGGDITRRDHGYLRTKQSTAEPRGKGHEKSMHHSHGLPSRFKAESDEKYAFERVRKARDHYRPAFEELPEYKEELHATTKTLKQVRFERDEARGGLKHYRKQLKDCDTALKTKQMEVEQWKEAFAKQKPLAMAERERQLRIKNAVESSVAAGTQTSPVESAGSTAPHASDGLSLEMLERFMEHGRELQAECDRLNAIIEDLQFQIDVLTTEARRPRQPSGAVGADAALLDQFMEKARELQAGCDQLSIVVEEQQQELADCKKQLAESEEQRKKLDNKYRRIRTWISTDQSAPLPSPCTPLAAVALRHIQAPKNEVVEPKHVTELREVSAEGGVSVKSWTEQTPGKVKTVVEVKLGVQSESVILGISWRTLMLFVIFFFLMQWLGSCYIVS